jgi:hypothetical protein
MTSDQGEYLAAGLDGSIAHEVDAIAVAALMRVHAYGIGQWIKNQLAFCQQGLNRMIPFKQADNGLQVRGHHMGADFFEPMDPADDNEFGGVRGWAAESE